MSKRNLWFERRAVVLGLPAYSTVDMKTQECIERNLIMLQREGIKVAIIRGHGTYVHDSRNNIVEQAFNSFPEFTHLQFIDADMGFNDDLIFNLMNRRVDICGAIYVQKAPPYRPNAGLLEDNGVFYDLGGPDYRGTGLQEVDMIGTGLLCIRRNVLVQMQPPWFDFETLESPRPRKITPYHTKKFETLGEDVYFCKYAQKAGFKIWMDLDNQGVHYGQYGYTLADFLNPDVQALADAEKKTADWNKEGYKT